MGHDLSNTKGHTAGLTSGQWHPLHICNFLTGCEDGTLRIWDTEKMIQKSVINPDVTKPKRIGIAACCYNTDGQQMAASLCDGSLHIWDIRGKIGTSATVGTVPAPRHQMIERQFWSFLSGSETTNNRYNLSSDGATGLIFSNDSVTLVTREKENSLKFWDLRNLNQVIATFTGLPNAYTNTQAIFCPNEEFLLTGTSTTKLDNGRNASGTLCFINRKKLEIVQHLGVSNPVLQMVWSPNINQIIFAGGDRSKGYVKIFFDIFKSKKGIILSLNKLNKSKSTHFNCTTKVIYPFHIFERQQVTKRKLIEMQKEKNWKFQRPNKGRNCRLNISQSTLLRKHILKKFQGTNFGSILNQDPREVFVSFTKRK